jgi:ABC-type multidrug transport system fused ATPase/permease subunit
MVDEPAAVPTVIDLLRTTRRLLDRSTMRRIYLSIPFALVVAGLESIALGLVLPFIQVATRPAAAREGGIVERLYDLSGSNDTDQFLVILGGVIFGVFLLRAAVSVAFTWWQAGFLFEAEARTAARLFEGYLRAPYPMHLERNSSELIRNVQTSMATLFTLVVQSALTIVTELTLLAAIGVVLFALEPLMAIVALLFYVLAGGVYLAVMARPSVRLGRENQEYSRRTHQEIQQGLDGVKEIQAIGAVEAFAGQFRASRIEWAAVRRRQAFLQQIPRYYLETALIVSVLLLALLLVAGGSGHDAVAALGLFATAAFRALPSVNRILVSGNLLKLGSDAAGAVAADERYLWASPEPTSGNPMEPEQISIRDVHHRYVGATSEALSGVSFDLRRGEAIGLVGPSGAGKTTVIDLVLGLLGPTSGDILVDGVPIATDLPAWRQAIGYVSQHVFLMDDRLDRNIALGVSDREIDAERLAEAVELAQLGPLVASLPDGLATRIGERGTRLSGGERQRIAIARALYRRPRLLILDEATSALDGDTEARISRTIEAVRADMATLIVAHRLSTVQHCDRLVLLIEGQVAAEGSFEQLVATNGRFAELVRLGQLTPAEHG